MVVGQVAIYRFFHKTGAILYVGISIDPLKRLDQHRLEKSWYKLIHKVEIEWVESEYFSRLLEANAIKVERPIMNLVHNESFERGFLLQVEVDAKKYWDGFYFCPHTALDQASQYFNEYKNCKLLYGSALNLYPYCPKPYVCELWDEQRLKQAQYKGIGNARIYRKG